MWTNQQIEHHKKAAKLLIKIKDLTFKHIQNSKHISEYEVQQFILKKFDACELEIDNDPPIVSFNLNTSTPEYYPKKESKQLKENTFIMIDLWAKLKVKDAPFADITWTAYFGNEIPEEIKTVFNVVKTAKNTAIEYIENQLSDGKIPAGKEVDTVVREIITKAGYAKQIKHEIGHSLGIEDDHGEKPNWIYPGNDSKLEKNWGYTIEPGIYLEGKFGVRSEIDFYISDDNKMIITTDSQKEIIVL
jgi:Xaa-Pro aminopeptidase